jgi:hypothetical protein
MKGPSHGLSFPGICSSGNAGLADRSARHFSRGKLIISSECFSLGKKALRRARPREARKLGAGPREIAPFMPRGAARGT